MASPQPPLITPQIEMSTQYVDQAGYHFQKFMKIMRNTGPSKGTTSHRRCASKGKEPLPLPEPFSSESSSQSTGSSQTERSPARNKRKHRREDSRKPSSTMRRWIIKQAWHQ
ncbi:hypothetical protein ACOSQ2_002441 [Xanthoceras sorbifolium]